MLTPERESLYAYLEGACGHEFEWKDEAAPPSEGICQEHGFTALWALRLAPRTDVSLPRGVLTDWARSK